MTGRRVVALLVLAAALVVSGCGGSVSPAPAATATGRQPAALPAEVSVTEAARLRDAGAFVLDVREPAEWTEVHIPGATLIPLGQLSGRLDEVPLDRQVVVYCRSGNRSAPGRDILLAAGFTSVTSVTGGLGAWQAAGLPTEAGG